MGSNKPSELSVFQSIPDSHLQSPIRPQERQFLTTDKGPIPRRFKALRKTCPKPVDLLRIDSEHVYGLLLKESYSYDCDKILDWVKIHVPQSADAALDVVKKIYRSLGLGDIEVPVITQEVLYWYSLTCRWEDIRSATQALSSDTQTWKNISKPPSPIDEAWYSGSFLILMIQGQNWLLSYDQVMMISDTLLARCNTFILHTLQPQGIPGNIDPSTLVILYQLFDNEFLTHGNSLYSQIKSWEAVVSGLLIQLNDPFPGGKEFLETLLDEARKTNKPLISSLYDILISLDLDMHQFAEIYGMFRHFGHPTVDEDSGCNKVTGISKSRPVVSQHTMKSITGCIIRQFCSSFITKHGRWPNTESPSTISNPLLQHIIERNITYINLYTANIKIEDWADIVFSKELDLDYFVDYTQLLDDKSLAPELPDLSSIYEKDLLKYNPKTPKTSRRLLQRVMDGGGIN